MGPSPKEILMALKASANQPGPKFGLRVPGFGDYFIRPVSTTREHLNPLDVACLTNWRNHFVNAFLTNFIATEARTSTWLTAVVSNDSSRILFMIENQQCEPVGYLGIAFIDWEKSYVEADAVVSGGATPKGLMSAALATVLHWAQKVLHLNTVRVRVLADNPALVFYRKLGFIELERAPLRKIVCGQDISWVEDRSMTQSDRYLVYLNWQGGNN